MAQLPKGGLVRAHDKPIHGSCAIYFPGGIQCAVSFCWLFSVMDFLGIGDNWYLFCLIWMSVNICCQSVIYFKLCTSKKNLWLFSIFCTTFNTTHWQLQPHTKRGSLLATLLSCGHKLAKSWHKNLRRNGGYKEWDDSMVFRSFPSLKAKSLTASWHWLAMVISYQRWRNNLNHLQSMFPPTQKGSIPFFPWLCGCCTIFYAVLGPKCSRNVIGFILRMKQKTHTHTQTA